MFLCLQVLCSLSMCKTSASQTRQTLRLVWLAVIIRLASLSITTNLWTKLRFDKQVDPKDKPWPDPITIRRDAGGNRGGFTREQSWNYVLKSNFHAVPKGWHWFDRNRDKVLRDTGTLFNSISRDFGKDFAIVGTDLSYAEKLQTGRFPFIGITSRTESNLDIAMNAFLKGAFK